jgi:hypothetical protein
MMPMKKPFLTLFLTSSLAIARVESLSFKLPIIVSQYESSISISSYYDPRRGRVECNFSSSHDNESGTSKHGGLLELRGGSRSNDSNHGDVADQPSPRLLPRLAEQWRTFSNKNFFLLGMFVAVGLARAVPSVSQ